MTLNSAHLRLLHDASLEFNSTLDLDELLPRVFDRVVEALDAEAGSIWLRRGETLFCEIARGPVSERIEGMELPWGAGIVGDVGLRGEPELVANAADDPRFVHQVDEATGFATHSMVAAPLVAKGEVLGVMQLINKRSGTGRFDEDDRDLLEALGSTAGLALHNAQLHDAEKRARDLRSLLQISREVNATLEVDRLVLTVVNLASQALAYDRAAIALDEAGQPVVKAISGQELVNPKAEDTQTLGRMVTWLLERATTTYIEDVTADTEDARAVRSAFGDYVADSGVRSLCLIPLKDEEGRLGAFYMESSSPAFLGESGLEAAELLANQTSVALRNAELYSQVPLIGFLQPIAAWRNRVSGMSGRRLLARYGLPALAVLVVVLFPWKQRTGATEAELLPGARMPMRATVGGLVTQVLVDEGDQLEEGQVLAVLRDDNLSISLREAQAEHATAVRTAATARARGDESAARVAEISAAELAGRVDLLNDQLGRTQLRAPVGGVVLTMRPWERVGEWLDAGETFVLLGRTDRLELEARVPEQHIDRVRVGQKVRLKVLARPEHTFVGRVTEIAPQAEVDEATGASTFVVRAGIDNSEQLLRPGMDARAKIVGDRRPLGWIVIRPLVEWMQLRFWR
ncbi:MAG: GAF domain-containing protein [Gemmatimonadales bacterium]